MNFRTRWPAYLAYALVVVAAFLSGYLSARAAIARGRADLEAVAVASAQANREAGVKSCRRGVASYAANARGWREARARNSENAHDHGLPESARIAAGASAAVYRTVVEDLTGLMVDCEQAWPPVNTARVRAVVRAAAKGSP